MTVDDPGNVLARNAKGIRCGGDIAASNHYKVEFENDKVRVIRISYAPGEESALHDHKNGVVVNLTNFSVQFTAGDDTKPPVQDVAWPMVDGGCGTWGKWCGSIGQVTAAATQLLGRWQCRVSMVVYVGLDLNAVSLEEARSKIGENSHFDFYCRIWLP